MTSPYLTVDEAAAYLRLKPATIYGMVHERRLTHRKHGGRLVFEKADLDAWSKANETQALANRNGVPNFVCAKNSLRHKRTRSLKTEHHSKVTTSAEEVP